MLPLWKASCGDSTAELARSEHLCSLVLGILVWRVCMSKKVRGMAGCFGFEST